jgi:hypothetical protein
LLRRAEDRLASDAVMPGNEWIAGAGDGNHYPAFPSF